MHRLKWLRIKSKKMKRVDESPYSLIICVHQSRIAIIIKFIFIWIGNTKRHQPSKIYNYFLIIPKFSILLPNYKKTQEYNLFQYELKHACINYFRKFLEFYH